MKKIFSWILIASLLLTACTPKENESSATTSISEESVVTEIQVDSIIEEYETEKDDAVVGDSEDLDAPEFDKLSDPELLTYVEDAVYEQLAEEYSSDEYIIEDVTAVYISQEYIDELAYNSLENIYYGYTLSEVEEEFKDTKYVFTLGDDGKTVVTEFVDYDDAIERIIKNVAIGTGVILVCVTISVVTAGSAPAISMICAASAKTGTEFALSSYIIGGTISGGITLYETGDVNAALRSFAVDGSEDFKSGAIMGVAIGGISEAAFLKFSTKGGLTMDEAALIQKEGLIPKQYIKTLESTEEYNKILETASKTNIPIENILYYSKDLHCSMEVVGRFKSAEEAAIYFDQAKLQAMQLGDQMALVKDMDKAFLNYESELSGETVTNLERMKRGYAAIDPATGEAFELHHIGQSIDSPLAMLTKSEHMSGGNNTILHDANIADGEGVHSLMSNSEWDAQRKAFWKNLYEIVSKGL